MKLLKKIRKGFTLIELVVVIAVIAILAAVSVVSYVSITNKAKQSNDQQKIDQVNISLQSLEITGSPKTMYDAVKAVEEDGFKPENFKEEAKNYRFAYAMEENRFVIVEKLNKVVYPKDYKDLEMSANLWLFSDSTDIASAEAKFSHYLRGKDLSGTVNCAAGLDVGDNTGISAINYASSVGQEVVIRTYGQFTNLNVDGELSEVTHYGVGKDLEITKVKNGTFYEYGSWRKITLEYGKLEISSESFVGELEKNGGSVVNNGVVATPITGTDASSGVSGSGTNGITANTKISVDNAEKLMNLAFSQSTGVFGDASLNIELSKSIDLTGKTWVPFGALNDDTHYPFSGTIDGKGHSIIGLNNGSYKGQITQNNSTSTTGYFYGFITRATGDVVVKNITFSDVAIDSDLIKTVGVVISDTIGASSVTLHKVTVSGSVSALDKVGGLIGYAQGTASSSAAGAPDEHLPPCKTLIQECVVNATLKAVYTSGWNRAGGFIGYIGNNGIVSIYDSSFSGSVTGETSGTKCYGAFVGALGSWSKDKGLGLRMSGCSVATSVSVGESSDNQVVSTSGVVVIGKNQIAGSDHEVNLNQLFTLKMSNTSPDDFLARLN